MKVKKPVRDLIYIKPDEMVEKKIGGIIIPNQYQGNFNTGVVISKGNGIKDINLDEISVGDKVLYQKGAGMEIKSDDVSETFILVRYDSIFAVIED
jgi:co-chaperonin GroES (HSP10)